MKPGVEAMASMLFAACLSCGAARADVYAYTGDDGEVFLSNVPVDSRYKVLVAGQEQAALPVPAARAPARPDLAHYGPMVDEAARTFDLDRALLHAVIAVESHYNPMAVSRKGAMGLMQLMPETARRYGAVNAFDPRQNVLAGAQYLRDLLKLFNSDKRLALAAYNAGENAVIRSGNRIPPFRETLTYVPKVLSLYQRYQVTL